MNVNSLYGNRVFWTATSAVNAYPGGIGYANRVQGAGGFLDDFWQNVSDAVSPALGDLAKGLMTKGWIETKKAMGYRIEGPVTVDGVAYVKALNPQGIPVLIDASGTDTPYTPDKQSRTLKYDPATGRFTPMAVGIGIGVVAIAAIAAFFLLRRR